MTPIRLGVIGLSSSGWSIRAHLPYLKQSSKYNIIGILNSTKASAEKSIQAHGLPSTTKAYGSPQELADDPEVDAVVCTIRVDRHYDAVLPSVKNGKDLFVEWPLAGNLKDAKELNRLAKESGSKRLMVGLQARTTPVVNKVKQLVDSGLIGKVLSVNIRVTSGSTGTTQPLPEAQSYFNDPNVGGNLVSIHLVHTLDGILYALGELKTFSVLPSIQRTSIKFKDANGKITSETTRLTPDTILLQGQLENGAALSYFQRSGNALKGTPAFEWRIYGEKGELQVTSSEAFFQMDVGEIVLKHHDHEKDTLEELDLKIDEAVANLTGPPKSIGRLYEHYAEGATGRYADWDEAVRRHELIDAVWQKL